MTSSPGPDVNHPGLGPSSPHTPANFVYPLAPDPPFPHLHLLCCRNQLIYVDGDAQRKHLPLLHHTLSPDGGPDGH
jgi:hypothetical protein